MSETNKQLVLRHFEEIWNKRDLDVCDEIMAADYTENAAAPFGTAVPGRVDGPAAMRRTVAWLTGQYPDIRMEVEAVVAERDLVAGRVLSTGTFDGQVDGGPPPTGRRFAARQTHWFRVADGRLCEHWATRDDLTAMIQVGLVAPPR